MSDTDACTSTLDAELDARFLKESRNPFTDKKNHNDNMKRNRTLHFFPIVAVFPYILMYTSLFVYVLCQDLQHMNMV